MCDGNKSMVPILDGGVFACCDIKEDIKRVCLEP
jgi:hypothetical protein